MRQFLTIYIFIMKKIALFAVVALIGTATMTSCSKKRECTCTTNGTTKVHDMKDADKDEAELACQALDAITKMTDEKGGCEL